MLLGQKLRSEKDRLVQLSSVKISVAETGEPEVGTLEAGVLQVGVIEEGATQIKDCQVEAPPGGDLSLSRPTAPSAENGQDGLDVGFRPKL